MLFKSTYKKVNLCIPNKYVLKILYFVFSRLYMINCRMNYIKYIFYLFDKSILCPLAVNKKLFILDHKSSYTRIVAKAPVLDSCYKIFY